MKPLNREDAEAIATKLRAVRDTGARKHETVRFFYREKLIFSFGIRRGSGELPHSYIPNQMKISQKECRTFRQCNMSLEKFIEILRVKQIIAE